MATTKTTFYLTDDLRSRLKAQAARRRTTLSSLLVEGAEMAIARHQGEAAREELLRLARAAERELREGLYEGASVAREADELAYPRRAEDEPPARAPDPES